MEEIKNELTYLDNYNPIFINNEDAINFFIRYNFFSPTINCSSDNCLGTMSIQNNKRYKNGKVYRCNQCRKAISLNNGNNFFKKFRLDFNIILRCIYCWINNYQTYQAIQMCQINEDTYSRFRVELIDTLTESNEVIKIGGPGIKVQIGERAICNCNGKIIWNPSQISDIVSADQIQWIVAGIDEESKRLFLELVPNKTSETMLRLFYKYLEPGTIIVTNANPYYSTAVHAFGSEIMIQINDTMVSETGAGTNNIKNIWSQIKGDIQRQHGLIHEKIPQFLKEFSCRKNIMKKNTPEWNLRAFFEIMKIIKK